MQKYSAATAAELPSLVDILIKRAIDHPDRRAYTFLLDGKTECASLTYRELDNKARSIGALLRERGTTGHPVLLLYPSGLDYISAFFGCLYAGAIAVPAYPPSSKRSLPRIQAICADARPHAILTTGDMAIHIQRRHGAVSELDQLPWIFTDEIGDNSEQQNIHVSENMLAFLQYTSGSTGNPKGVMVSHRNLMHNCKMINESLLTTPQTIEISWLPMFHDLGLIGGILLPTYVGFSAILMAPATFLQRPLNWLEAISHYGGTISYAPNFAYELCVRKTTSEECKHLDLRTWQQAVIGAEPIRKETLERFTATFRSAGFRRESFTPGYGLAEGTLMVSLKEKNASPIIRLLDQECLERNQVVDVPLKHGHAQAFVGCGLPGRDQRVLIVHPETQLECRPGEVGELWIAGPSVAQGYWNQQEETKQTFRATLADSSEGPFLRTGDLGFKSEYGELFITGRLKDLIILRGLNHYPQDIELTVQQSHPALRLDSGAAFSVEVAGEEQLVVVQEIERHAQNENTQEICKTIREAITLQHEIAVYSVILLQVGSIAKTSSGKIQRQACKKAFFEQRLSIIDQWHSDTESDVQVEEAVEVDHATFLSLQPDERRQMLENYLCALTSRILQLNTSEIQGDQLLVALGFDSLLSITFKNHIENDLRVAVPLVSILENTFHQFVPLLLNLLSETNETPQSVSGLVSSQPLRITPAIRDNQAPLSFAQQSLWLLDQLVHRDPFYTITVSVCMTGRLVMSALKDSLQEIIKRHEVLHTIIRTVDEQPVAVTMPTLSLLFPLIDLRSLSLSQRENEVSRLASQEAQSSFDLEQGPLLRIRVLRLAEQKHILLLSMHHIVSDGWSMNILLQELATRYVAALHGQQPQLPALPIQYADYALWQRQWLRGSVLDDLIAYWREQLTDLPILQLPTDFPRPPVQTHRGQGYEFFLPSFLLKRLHKMSRQEGITLFMTLLAAFQVLLARYSGQYDVVIGIPVANRGHLEIENLIGFFVNTLVLRTSLADNLDLPGTIATRAPCLPERLCASGATI